MLAYPTTERLLKIPRLWNNIDAFRELTIEWLATWIHCCVEPRLIIVESIGSNIGQADPALILY